MLNNSTKHYSVQLDSTTGTVEKLHLVFSLLATLHITLNCPLTLNDTTAWHTLAFKAQNEDDNDPTSS